MQRETPRIALVTPFFGRDAGHPDERFLFEFVAQMHVRGVTMEVMTTCARSVDDNWSANYYRAGTDTSEAFPIERFRVGPRDSPAYDAALLALAGATPETRGDDLTFVREGVRSPDLITHINRVVDAYDAFVFWPYESATTLEGISVVAERAIVMPRLNADPLRFARIVRERLRNARAFFVRDEVEHDALVTLLGSDIERHVRVIGPSRDGAMAWDETARAVIDAVVALPSLDDGRSLQQALAQIAYLYPVVRRQRSVIIAMQQSRFWKLRNAWFAFKKRSGFRGEDTLLQIAPESEAAELSAVADPYFLWRERNAFRPADRQRFARIAAVLPHRPTFGVVIDVGGAGPEALERTIGTLRAQLWGEWRAVVVAPAHATTRPDASIAALVAGDARIVRTTGDAAGAIATAGTDYVLPLDPGDALEPDALLEFALAANVDPAAAAIYADEDEIGERSVYRFPFFKPDWSPDTALSRDYIGRPCAIARQLALDAGGLRPAHGPAAWFDLLLRVAERSDRIAHVSRVLYHRAATAPAQSPEAVRAVLTEALERRGEGGTLVDVPVAGNAHFTVRYPIRGDERVCIVIPTRDRHELLAACLDAVFERSTYQNFSVMVVDNGSRELTTIALFDAWRQREPDRFSVLAADIPFNFSALNNLAVAKTDAEFIVMLNNDTVVITPDWIEAMLEQARRPSIGAVGALLLYPDDTVQHAGVIMGVLGLAGHAHRYFPAQSPGHFGALQAPTNYLAVTAACLMIERSKYEAVHGMDERLAVSCNDVDFCLRLYTAGLRSIYLPHVRLYHFESKSRGGDDTPSKVRRTMDEIAIIRERWPILAHTDPFYNPNLTIEAEDFGLRH